MAQKPGFVPSLTVCIHASIMQSASLEKGCFLGCVFSLNSFNFIALNFSGNTIYNILGLENVAWKVICNQGSELVKFCSIPDLKKEIS